MPTDIELLNKPLAELLAERIEYFTRELATAKAQLAMISDPIASTIAAAKEADKQKLPSNAEMIEMIKIVLKENEGKWIKTSTVVNRFYADQIQNKEDREFKQTITRRFSGAFAALKESGTIESKKVPGERGDMYMSSEDFILQ